ncbi:MAG: TrkA family potassium uptake protein [Oscillospiraceae bacterium]|nr:TrkA family potassium uptake protein [Oscillospiraceae bacterium]
MNILIVGCGKVGSTLASVLNQIGHDVSIIDRDESRFGLLAPSFTGYTITGVPIDQDILRRAGIDGCDAVIAVTENDNVNIMVCELAREVFHVGTVLARVYDSRRRDVFTHFKLETVCPTDLTVDAVCAVLDGASLTRHIAFGDTTVSYLTKPVGKAWIGHLPSHVVPPEGSVVFGVLHPDGKFELVNSCENLLTSSDRLVLAHTLN